METEVRNIEVQKPPFKFLSKKAVIISLVTFILLMLAVTAQLSYMILNHDKVYKGVYVSGTYAGNLTQDELRKVLQTNFTDNIKNSKITLKCKDISENFSFENVDVKYDIEKAIDQAYSVGRTGSIFQRFGDILKARKSDVSFEIPITFDKEKVNNILQNIYSKTLIKVKEADLLIQDGQITIRSGHHGENIDKDKIYGEVEKFIRSHKSASIDIPIIVTDPSRINVNEYYNQINREVKDATFKVVNNKLEIVPEVIGRSINKDDLEKIATELEKTENTEKVLPVNFIKPGIKTADVHAKLFKDVLYSMKTHFNTNTQNNRNRSENIRITSSKINGKLLAPGEVFSFNGTVGERTIEAGYKDAYVYQNGKVVPGLAGGLCQVSSTLYNAVLQSDLEIVERRNHSFIVAYVKPGTDATIYSTITDFKFRNSTKWPIKVESYITKDNYLFVNIRGTNENPGKVIELNSVIRSEKPFVTNYVDDPNLPVGQQKILQEGHNGMTVDTYKIVKINGKVTSTKKITTSVYKPLSEEISRGTKKDPTVAATPKPGTKPAANTNVKPSPTPKPTQEGTGNTGTDTAVPNADDIIDSGQ